MNQITNSNLLILIQAAHQLGITTKIISIKPPVVKFIYHDQSHLITEKSLGINQSPTAKIISRNKSRTLTLLKQAGLPVPKHTVVTQPDQYPQTLQTIPFPQVIKPLTGEKGKHIYLNVNHLDQGQTAVNQILQRYPHGCIVETYYSGNDYRFLVLHHQLIGLSQRLPPTITGDNQHTLKQLIQIENQKRFRTNQKLGKRMLNRMRNWPRISWNLQRQNLSLDTILPKNKTITLYPVPNFSTGGSVKTIDPQTIHPQLIKLAEKAAKTIDLEITGIDMLIQDLHQPPAHNAVIIEVNSDPGLRLHDWPNQGQPQHVAQKILQSIFDL